MMDYDYYKILRKQDQLEEEKSKENSADLYVEASELAKKAGWILRKHSDIHYSIWQSAEGWLLNFYPGNSRIFYDPNRKKGPYLKLKDEKMNNILCPTILDVVRAAIKANGVIINE